jgi:hypothetical protein
VVWKTHPALARVAVVPALTLVLASCGGGSTAGPIPPTTDAATVPAPPPAVSPSTTAAAPRTTEVTPDSPSTRTRSGRSRAPGGAPPPADTTADSSAAVADEPPPEVPEETTAPQPAVSTLDERANLILTRRVSPSHYFQQGTVLGTYDGTMEVEARITSKGVLVKFTATLPGGTISGRGIAVAILDSATWPSLRGTARVTRGTGRFAGIQGRRLRVTGRAKPDASRAHVRLAGAVTLP